MAPISLPIGGIARGLATALATWLWLVPAMSAEPIVYGAIMVRPFHAQDGSGLLDRLFEEMFRRLGRQVESVDIPPARSIDLLNRGVIDARVGTPALIPFATQAVHVPGSLVIGEVVALSKSVTALPDGWASLARYRVAHLRGWKVIEEGIPKGDNVYAVNLPHQMFEMLDSGRVDIVVAERLASRMQLREMGVEGVRVLEPPLLSSETYVFLHKKHGALVPQLDASLRAMKADGTYRRIYEETLRDFGLD